MAIGILGALALAILLYTVPEHGLITYTYPVSGTYTSYEVRHSSKGYINSVYEYTEYGLTDAEKQAMFEESRTREDALAEYQEARAIAEADNADSFEEAEEQRIEEYCKEEGIGSCYNIKYTCKTEYRCYLVTIECDEPQYEPYKEMYDAKYACKEWKVTVDNEFDIRDVDETYWQNYGYEW